MICEEEMNDWCNMRFEEITAIMKVIQSQTIIKKALKKTKVILITTLVCLCEGKFVGFL